MKKIALLLLSFAVTESSLASDLTSEKGDEAKGFKGNWTKTFILKDQVSDVTHTPNKIQMGFFTSGTGFNIQMSTYNEMPLTAPLNLKVDSTQEEFTQALITSGLFIPLDD